MDPDRSTGPPPPPPRPATRRRRRKIIVEPTPKIQAIYNRIRDDVSRQQHEYREEIRLGPAAYQLGNISRTSTGENLAMGDGNSPATWSLAKRPPSRHGGPLKEDSRLKIALQRALKPVCVECRSRKVACDCYDFSRLEKAYVPSISHSSAPAWPQETPTRDSFFGSLPSDESLPAAVEEGEPSSLAQLPNALPHDQEYAAEFDAIYPFQDGLSSLAQPTNAQPHYQYAAALDAYHPFLGFIPTPVAETAYYPGLRSSLVDISAFADVLFPVGSEIVENTGRWRCEFVATEISETCSWTGLVDDLDQHWKANHYPIRQTEQWSECIRCFRFKYGWEKPYMCLNVACCSPTGAAWKRWLYGYALLEPTPVAKSEPLGSWGHTQQVNRSSGVVIEDTSQKEYQGVGQLQESKRKSQDDQRLRNAVYGSPVEAEDDHNSQGSASGVSERRSFPIGESTCKRTFSSDGEVRQTQPHDHDSQNHASSDASDDDTRTEYSVATNPEDGDYISELANDLLAQTLELARTTQVATDAPEEEQIWNRIFAYLPIMLQDFSLSVGHQASKQIQRDIMVFVHRHRRRIAEAFRAAYFSEANSFSRRMYPKQDKNSLVSQWLETSESAGQPEPATELSSDDEDGIWPPRECDEDDETENDKSEAGERVQMYGSFISGLEAYQWLQTRLCRELLTTPAEPDVMTEISQQVMDRLPRSQRVSRLDSSKTYEATFQVGWNPQSFLVQQGYQGDPGDAIANTLTFTGSAREAQAVSCAEYLCEMWPLTGKVICELMKHVVRDKCGVEHSAEFYDHTKMSACIDASHLVVKASGTKVSLAELAQQLAWLGSALPVRQGQPDQSASAYCKPLLVQLGEQSSTDGQSASNPVWGIQFEMRGEGSQADNSNGQCWTNLIRNRVLAQGYPIRRRPKCGTGLEISLDAISWLVQAPHATVFDGNLFIKGPRTMLLLAEQAGNALLWHLLESQDGTRISYVDPRIPMTFPEAVSLSKLKDLESSRHFVGWCSKAISLVGTPEAMYDIGISDFEPSLVCPFKSMPISPGVRISRGKGFSVAQNGNAANSSFRPERGYLQRLHDLTKESVALFDSADKRSWLVDGVSVLLHLTRASLKREEEDLITSSWYQFKMKEYGQGSRRSENAAFSILMNRSNLEAPLHDTPDGCSETFKQRVEEIWSFLEMIMDDEKRANEKQHSCEFLEAFEFRHIATVTGPVSRCAIQLPPEGSTSINLCRQINAVTLVGRGFGELIRSISSEGLCSSWQEVPRDRGYICVQTSHLRHIIEHRTDKQYLRWGRIGNLYWNKADMQFDERCDCRKGGTCNYARTLLTADQFDESKGGPAGKTSESLPPSGALIFGCASRSSASFEPEFFDRSGLFGSSRGSATTARDNSPATSSTHLQHLGLSSPSEQSTQEEWSESTGLGDRKFASTREAAHYEGNREAGQQRNDEKQKLVFQNLVHRPMVSDPNGGVGHPKTITHKPQRPQSRAGFNVVVICALPLEAEAFGTFFDQRWDIDSSYGRAPGDPNAYSAGAMGPHNVVLVHMSGMGKSNAASVAAYVKTSFPNIQLALVVGICGAVPLPPGKDAIVLGDVIISNSIFQYDLGRRYTRDDFKPKKELRESLRFHTCQKLLNLMARLNTQYERKRLEAALAGYKDAAPRGPDFDAHNRDRPDVGRFHTERRHIDSTKPCDEYGCGGTREQLRRLGRGNPEPTVHIGRLASGDTVYWAAEERDAMAQNDGILGVEMEGAGVWDHFPCLVIKGACDYADNYKSKEWQPYAAATAAACAKAFLLLYWEPSSSPT